MYDELVAGRRWMGAALNLFFPFKSHYMLTSLRLILLNFFPVQPLSCSASFITLALLLGLLCLPHENICRHQFWVLQVAKGKKFQGRSIRTTRKTFPLSSFHIVLRSEPAWASFFFFVLALWIVEIAKSKAKLSIGAEEGEKGTPNNTRARYWGKLSERENFSIHSQ